MSFHLFDIQEIYSSADGTIQFVELINATDDVDERFLQNQMLKVTSGDLMHQFVFPHNLPDESTAHKTVLIATQGYADLGLVAPDYIVPNGFLFTAGGTLNYANVDVVTYAALPLDGGHSLDDNGIAVSATPENFAGTFAAMPKFVEGTAGNDSLEGTAVMDLVRGFAGDDTLGGNGNGGEDDIIDGGDGRDTGLLYALSSGITGVSGAADHLEVTAWGRTTTFIDVERIQTFDALFAFDTNVGDSLWNLAALWWAGTGHAPSPVTLWNYMHEADAATSLNELSHVMLDLVGASDVGAADFVTYLFMTALGVNPSQDDVAAVTALMGAGHLFETNADLLAYVAVQPFNTDKMVDFTGSVQRLEPSDIVI